MALFVIYVKLFLTPPEKLKITQRRDKMPDDPDAKDREKPNLWLLPYYAVKEYLGFKLGANRLAVFGFLSIGIAMSLALLSKFLRKRKSG